MQRIRTKSKALIQALSLPDTRNKSFEDAITLFVEADLRLVAVDDKTARPSVRYLYTDDTKSKLKPRSTADQVLQQAYRMRSHRIAAVVPKGYIVLDIDHRPENAWDADEILNSLKQLYCLEDCPLVRTPSGGYHCWYQLPVGANVRNWSATDNRSPLPGIDGKLWPTLVTLPGSIRPDQPGKPGGVYNWAHYQAHIPMISDALLKAIELPPVQIRTGPVRDFNEERFTRYVAAAYSGEIRKLATCSSGGRHIQLCRSSYALGRFVGAGAIPEDHAQQSLLEAAQHCGLVLDEGQRAVISTIKSGLAKGAQNPREIPAKGVAS